ncbi:MAG: MerR family transcriptional regulator [Candidatus Omnitrophica bacterium]|nr:MerR family transcriptional regulator [Candidatus Omnitrophota bacterium]MCB9746936.1 MerR family transcriptional regulator [Candidatus Omnitrophota bacterium]
MNKRMTITEVAEIVGISPKTIVRWEKVGKVRKAKRDWRGWRIYDEHDLDSIRQFRETISEG